MPSTPPFIDPDTGDLDFDRLMYEAIPIAKLIVTVGAVAVLPFAFAVLLGRSALAGLFVLATQFVLAVGGALVLLYVVRRALQLAAADAESMSGTATDPSVGRSGDGEDAREGDRGG